MWWQKCKPATRRGSLGGDEKPIKEVLCQLLQRLPTAWCLPDKYMLKLVSDITETKEEITPKNVNITHALNRLLFFISVLSVTNWKVDRFPALQHFAVAKLARASQS